MYEAFFGMTQCPFSATPDASCFVALSEVNNVLDALRTCVSRARGIAVLTGAAGTGKTLVCERLVRDLGSTFQCVLLSNANFTTVRSLLQAILYELGRPYSRMDEQELRLELATALKTFKSDSKRGLLLIIDEAHLLNAELLEEIRTVTNLVAAGEPLVRVVLSGQLPLEERLISRDLEALNQRIGCYVSLGTLTRHQSLEFAAYRLQKAGVVLSEIFTQAAIELITHASDGIPRCLNQLCDHSLLLAFAANEKPVQAKTVRQALDDLKQLPLQWNEPTSGGDFETASAASPAEINTRVAPPDRSDEARVAVYEPIPNVTVDDRSFTQLMDYEAVSSGLDGCFESTCQSIEVGTHQTPIAFCHVGDVSVCGPTIAQVVDSRIVVETIVVSGTVVDDVESVGTADQRLDAEAAAQVISDTRRVASARQFEEEIVIDRYAALDGGIDAPTSAGIVWDISAKGRDKVSRNNASVRPAGTAGTRNGTVATGNRSGSADTNRQIRTRNDGADDNLWVYATADNSAGPANSSGGSGADFSAWDSIRSAPPTHASTLRAGASRASDEDFETKIGREVLELYCETQRAFHNRVIQSDTHEIQASLFKAINSASTLAGDESFDLSLTAGAGSQFDVVEPESVASRGSSANSSAGAPHSTKRPLSQLFSELRRRQNRV